MNDAPLNGLRRIIPRWRESQITLASRELISSRPGKMIDGGKSSIILKQQLWNEQRQIEYAADLVASALSQGYPNEAIEAAEFLISESNSTTPTVVLVAQDLLKRAGKLASNNDDNYQPSSVIDLPKIFEQIHSLRVLLNEYPRNAIMWADLSKAYAIIGQLDQSKSAMIKALILSPDNRFILRSATRLFIHLDEPDYAHRILISRPITSQDPWLIASEIATATVAGKTSKLVRLGKYILERGGYSPFQLAELASALATLELFDGSARKARKLFQVSLIDPNDNSVAQSSWARRWLPTLEMSPLQ